MSEQILVLGSSGKTGKRVAERLHAMNLPVRLGSRKEQSPFDWNNPNTWHQVLDGIKSVYITFQPDLAVPGSAEKIERFTEIAKASHVKRLVMLSGRGEKEAQACEQIVLQSGIECTIVRASWFMQNFSENFLLDGILGNDVVLPVIKSREPFVDADDIADVVVAALLNPGHRDKIYEVTGPELLSFEDAVLKIAAATGRQISYTEIGLDEYVSVLKSYQLPEEFIWLVRYLFTEVLDGRNESICNDIEKVLGRNPTTFDEYLTKTERTGVWKVQ